MPLWEEILLLCYQQWTLYRMYLIRLANIEEESYRYR